LDGGITTLLDSLFKNDLTYSIVSNWGIKQATSMYKQQMSKLISKENGFHFLTGKMTQEQLQSFDVEDLMKQMMVIAPDLWNLMETLHTADARINYQQAWTQRTLKKAQKAK
jgi:glycerophosphoryl diester phosphodiesterase